VIYIYVYTHNSCCCSFTCIDYNQKSYCLRYISYVLWCKDGLVLNTWHFIMVCVTHNEVLFWTMSLLVLDMLQTDKHAHTLSMIRLLKVNLSLHKADISLHTNAVVFVHRKPENNQNMHNKWHKKHLTVNECVFNSIFLCLFQVRWQNAYLVGIPVHWYVE